MSYLIVCKDGFRFSIAANDKGSYSTPRYSKGPYTAIEIGFPTRVEPLLKKYAEPKYCYETDDYLAFEDSATQVVYPYVPASLLIKVIGKHGGLKEGKLPPLISVPVSKD